MLETDYPQWAEGWQQRLRNAARELGYPSFLDFLRAHAGEPYGKVLRVMRAHLQEMVPMMQLQKLHMIEAIGRGQGREAAKDSLIRSLREHMPRGWNRGKKARENRASARAEWILPCLGPEDRKHIAPLADKVWQQLKIMNPPEDWCPLSTSDPILTEAFARGWPEE